MPRHIQMLRASIQGGEQVNKTSDAQLAASRKYRANSLERLTVQWKKGGEISKESLQEWAKSAGMSVNKYVITAIFEKHERDTQAETSEQE